MLKASALYFTIVIALLISIILSSLILLYYFSTTRSNSYSTKTAALENIKDGFTLILGEKDEIPYDVEFYPDLQENFKDSLRILKKKWGLFDYYSISSKRGKIHERKVALTGTVMINQPALYLADINRTLGIAGETNITGNVYLPKSGVKRTTINGKGYSGTQLIYGNIQTSDPILPKLNEESLKRILNIYKPSTDEIAEYVLEDTINSFHQTTIGIFYKDLVNLRDIQISGNIKIRSAKGIIVNSTANLEDVILIAPYIEFEEGFSGSVQAFSTDSILIGENVHLSYPSSVTLVKDTIVTLSPFILVGSNSTIDGTVLILNHHPEYRKDPYFILEKDAIINGLIYIEGLAEIKGKVYGSAYIQKLFLRTTSSFYENHLLDAKLNSSKASKYMAYPYLFSDKGKKVIVKWLD